MKAICIYGNTDSRHPEDCTAKIVRSEYELARWEAAHETKLAAGSVENAKLDRNFHSRIALVYHIADDVRIPTRAQLMAEQKRARAHLVRPWDYRVKTYAELLHNWALRNQERGV